MESPPLEDEWEIEQFRCAKFDEIGEYKGWRFSGATPSTDSNLCLDIGPATLRTARVNEG